MNGGAIRLDANLTLVVGGAKNYGTGTVSNRAYLIDFSGPSDPVVERLPNMFWPRTFVSLVMLPNGWVVVAGGQRIVKAFSDTDPVHHVEIYDPSSKTFHLLKSLVLIPRNYHSAAVLLRDGRVMIGGGGLCGGGCSYATKIVRLCLGVVRRFSVNARVKGKDILTTFEFSSLQFFLFL
jgi:galactose oxidase